MFDNRQTKQQIIDGGMKLHAQLVDAIAEIERMRHDLSVMTTVRDAQAMVIEERDAETERLLVFLREIAAMGPADGEWPANTLDDAVALAKRALNHEQKADGK